MVHSLIGRSQIFLQVSSLWFLFRMNIHLVHISLVGKWSHYWTRIGPRIHISLVKYHVWAEDCDCRNILDNVMHSLHVFWPAMRALLHIFQSSLSVVFLTCLIHYNICHLSCSVWLLSLTMHFGVPECDTWNIFIK